MKKLLSLFRKEMVRPIFYKCINKCSIVLAAVLLWDRFVNKGRLTVWDGCFIAAAILLGLAWLNYLRADGIGIPGLFRDRKNRKPRRHATSDIVDFVDEHITTFDELDEDEQLFCRFLSNLISGLIFLITSLVGLVV